MFSFRPLVYMIILVLLIIFWFGCDPPTQPAEDPPERTPAQQWEHWINLLALDMKNVEQSADWIEKHRGEISIPSRIDFMDIHTVLELPFLPYGIIITMDHNSKLRVGKHRAFRRGWPPDKTPLKLGDKLPDSFPIDMNIEWTGNSFSEFNEFLKNRTYNFVFEAKEIEARTDIGGSIVTYMSPEGATIHYNVDRIIIQIQGIVFKRHHTFTPIEN